MYFDNVLAPPPPNKLITIIIIIIIIHNIKLRETKTGSDSVVLLEYTGCPRRNGQNFGRVFLMLKYTDITQNTYIQS